MNWIYSIAFKMSNLGSISQAEAAVERLDSAVDEVGRGAARAGGKLEGMGRTGVNGFQNMMSAARAYLGVAALVATTLSSMNVAAQFDAQNIAIDFATDGNGAESIAFVKDLSDRLGLSLAASRDGYKQLAAATMNTPLQGQATNDLFEGVATAGAAMRLSEDQLRGAFLALGQIQSKGKVQAEELRGQLGERLPGAFRIAADSMGVTQQELNKMLETGQVLSEDFLPRFGAQLKKEFSSMATEVADGPAAAMERMRNETLQLQVAFGNQLLPVVNRLLSDFLIPATSYIAEHIELFMALGAGILAVQSATLVLTTAAQAAMMVTKLWTRAQWLLNVALTANPIGVVVVGIAALVAVIATAWNSSERFRGILMGVWEVMKGMATFIYDGLIDPLVSLGKVMAGAFTFDPVLIAEGLDQGAAALARAAESGGRSVAEQFQKGYNKGRYQFGDESNARNMGGRGSLFGRTDREAGQRDADAAALAGATSAGGRNGLSGITGRSSQKNITINLGSLVNDLKIQAATAQGGADEMEALVMRKLLQVLNTANQVQ